MDEELFCVLSKLCPHKRPTFLHQVLVEEAAEDGCGDGAVGQQDSR